MLIDEGARVHRIALGTAKVESLPSRFDVSRDVIGADADTYFDSNRRVVTKLSDPKVDMKIGSNRTFVAFTSAPTQILTYDRDRGRLERVELASAEVIWSKSLGKAELKRGYVSPDFAWTLISLGKKSWIVNNRAGSSRSVPFVEGQTIEFDREWLRIGSRLYRLAGDNKNKPRLAKDLLSYDFEHKISISRTGQVIGPQGQVEIGAGFITAAVMDTGLVLALSSGMSQTQFVNLSAREVRPVGRIFNKSFDQKSCLAQSATRRLLVVANTNQAEIFWSALISANNFRSVQVNLEN